MKKTFPVLLAATLFAFGCHKGSTQVPPSPPPTAAISWVAPSTCTTGNPACSYVVSRCTVATGTTCPSYTPLNQSSPVSTLSYTDSTPPTGINVLYVVQTVQSSLTGQPSAPSNLLAVPVYPGTPGTPNATTTAMLAPPLVTDTPQEVVASNRGEDLHVTARVGK